MFGRPRCKRGPKRSSGQSGDGRGADGRRSEKRGRSPSRSRSPGRSLVRGRESRSRSRRRAPAAASRDIVLRAAERAPTGASSSAGGVRRRVRRHSPRDGLPSRQRRHAPSPQVAPSGRRCRKARASDQATRPKRKGARQRHAGVVDTQPEERPRVGAKRRPSRLLVGRSVMPLVARRRRKAPVTQTAPSRREGDPRHAVDQPPAPGAEGSSRRSIRERSCRRQDGERRGVMQEGATSKSASVLCSPRGQGLGAPKADPAAKAPAAASSTGTPRRLREPEVAEPGQRQPTAAKAAGPRAAPPPSAAWQLVWVRDRQRREEQGLTAQLNERQQTLLRENQLPTLAEVEAWRECIRVQKAQLSARHRSELLSWHDQHVEAAQRPSPAPPAVGPALAAMARLSCASLHDPVFSRVVQSGRLCSLCRASLRPGSALYSCTSCGYDACESCADDIVQYAVTMAEATSADSASRDDPVAPAAPAADAGRARESMDLDARRTRVQQWPAGAANAADPSGKGDGKSKGAADAKGAGKRHRKGRAADGA